MYFESTEKVSFTLLNLKKGVLTVSFVLLFSYLAFILSIPYLIMLPISSQSSLSSTVNFTT